jgi:hypothetical protein
LGAVTLAALTVEDLSDIRPKGSCENEYQRCKCEGRQGQLPIEYQHQNGKGYQRHKLCEHITKAVGEEVSDIHCVAENTFKQLTRIAFVQKRHRKALDMGAKLGTELIAYPHSQAATQKRPEQMTEHGYQRYG